MSNSSNNNNTYYRGYLNVNTTNPKDAAFAVMWNASMKKEENRNDNNYYGSSYGGSMEVTTCNWGGFSNASHAFPASLNHYSR